MENFENEIWRPVVGYENLYEVSNYGRVKSLPQTGLGQGKGYWKNERVLKEYSYKGIKHYYVTLCKNGKVKHYFTHILVVKAFPEICGDWFDGAEVHHIDFNRFNNVATNLIVVNKIIHSEIHKNSDITHKRRSISKSVKRSKKYYRPVLQFDLNGNFIKEWDCVSDAAATLRIYTSHIYNVIKGKRNKCGGYIWKYKN